jgi:putative transposase
VRYLQECYGISERRACGLVGIGRSSLRYRSQGRDETALRTRLRTLALERVRFGYRRLQILLEREGIVANHQRVDRLDRAEGVAVRRRPRKRVAGQRGEVVTVATQPNQCWSLDFLSEALANGRRLRLLSVLDTFTREALAIEVDTSLPSARVVGVLDQVVADRGARPEEIGLDNGPELTSRALDQGAHDKGVRLRFVDPGKPIPNAHIESFPGRLRDECLTQHWFRPLADARRLVEDWRLDYNRVRPHSSLGYQSPEIFHQERQTTTIRQPEPVGLS